MTNLTRYEYDENGNELIIGVPVTSVTDQWDGEVNASGIQIQDAYNMENIQITGNSSAKQLTLLSQILNVKSQQRLINPEFKVESSINGIVQPTTISRRIGGMMVTKCYKSVGATSVSPYKVGGRNYSGEIIRIPLTYQQIVDNADLFPSVQGIQINTTPIPYQDYGYYIDHGVNVQIPVDSIAYYDANDEIHLFSEQKDLFETAILPCRFNMYLVAYKSCVEKLALIAEVNTSIDTIGYTYFRRVHSPGKSEIITDEYITEKSTVVVNMQYSSTYIPRYGRLFGAGKDNTANSISASYEEYQNGTLHVSYGGNTSWTTYSTITRDLLQHTYVMDKNSFYMDSTLIGTGPSSGFTSTNPFTIFGEGWSGESRDTHMASGFVYYSAVYEDDKPSAILYPARNSNGVYGLHDIVNNVFYTSDNLALTND